MATILSLILIVIVALIVAAAGAIVPEVVKRWLEARSRMERLRSQRAHDGLGAGR